METMSSTESGHVFSSHFPSVGEEVLKWKSLGHFLLDRMDGDNKDTVVITDHKSGRQYTGRQLLQKVLNVSCALVDKYNFEPHTAVCISYENSDYCTILALAVIFAGGFVACVSPKDPYGELLNVARKIGPKFLLSNKSDLSWAKKLEADLSSSDSNNVVTGIAIESELFDYDHKRSRSVSKIPVASENIKTQVAMVTMSSGSTGRPKAVPATHFTCLVELYLKPFSANEPKLGKGKSIVYSSSLQHMSARLTQFGAINDGYNVVILSQFNMNLFLKLVEEYKVESIHAGAGLLHNLIDYKKLSEHNLMQVVKLLPIGSEITYLEEFGEFLAKHKHIKRVENAYGSSEVGIVTRIHAQEAERFLENHRDCGQLIAGTRIKVVDMENGTKLLGKNQKGIIHVESDTLFPGYYDCSNSMSPFVKRPEDYDEDGFFITGDIGFVDDKEHVHMFGRQKELMICRSARKVIPQELEMVLNEHPAVSTSTVVGIECNFEGGLHCPRAFVVPKRSCYTCSEQNSNGNEQVARNNKFCSLPAERQKALAEQLIEFVNTRVGWERQLTGGVVILDAIPSLPTTGKIDKTTLRHFKGDQVDIVGSLCGK